MVFGNGRPIPLKINFVCMLLSLTTLHLRSVQTQHGPSRKVDIADDTIKEIILDNVCPNLNLHIYGPRFQDVLEFEKEFEIPDRSDQPVVLWWTGFTNEPGKVRSCGDNVECFFTVDRAFWKRGLAKVMLLFYGTDFDTLDMPLPRAPEDEWALLHEESPQNVYMFSHQEAISLFNHTSTFKRESDFPISTQYLHSIERLESKQYFVPTKRKSELRRNGGLAAVSFVQSDCGTLSDRDHLVKMLQKHIEVDSYGACLHNKDLPEHLTHPISGMDHEDFYHHQAQYKFILAFENAICDDYMTEKFWRPFVVGSIPVVWGSPKAKDFLPTNLSAIMISDFANVEDVAKLIKYLDENDDEYEKYLSHKHSGVTNKLLRKVVNDRTWGIGDTWNQGKPHFIDDFECFICKQAHLSEERTATARAITPKTANLNHYGCPAPRKFSDVPPGNLTQVWNERWASAWTTAKYIAMATRYFINEGKTGYTENDFMDKVTKLHAKYSQEFNFENL